MSFTATFGVMFGGALRLAPLALRAVRERPALFARALAAVWIGVPLLTAGVIVAFRVQGLGAAILLLMAFCPGIPVMLAATRSVKGAMATAFAALLLTAMTEPLLIPAGTRLLTSLTPLNLSVRPHHVLDVLLPTVFLPVALGTLVQAIAPTAAPSFARASDGVYAIGLVGCILAILGEGAPLLLRVPLRTLGAATLITLGDALLGFWAGGPDPEDRKALALATALGNPALALTVVEVSYPGYPAVALVSAYLVVRAVAMAPFEWWLKHMGSRLP